MLLRQKIFALIIGFTLFFIILELVRRRKLQEDYSWLWLITGVGVIVLVIWYDLLVLLTNLIGAVLPTTTLFLFGFIFLMLIMIHFSVKITRLTSQLRDLTQTLSILMTENDTLKKMVTQKNNPGE